MTRDMVTAANKASLATLISIKPTTEDLQRAADLKPNGVLAESTIPVSVKKAATNSGLVAIELPPRASMRFDEDQPVVGTTQGVWPGIQVEEGGSAKAAPSGAPWIDTNSGFLRFVRSATAAPVWIGVRPPAKAVITLERYLQAIADAGIVGARWIVALDAEFLRELTRKNEKALATWARMSQLMAYFESHNEWRTMKPAGLLAILQDVDSGALYSGGVLDMIAVKHTPVRPVPTRKMSDEAMSGTKMAVNVDPASLTDAQKQALRAWTRSGGTLLSGPSTWKFPAPKPDQITLSEADVKMLDEIWKEMNSMTGRKNLGVRLFNVSSMLSNLSEDGPKRVLHLVNYSGYPVENVTVHILGKFTSATLLAPGATAKKLTVYEVEDGTGVDIETVSIAASLLLE